MKNEFVDYPLALRMKALGFKERVLTYFEDHKLKLHDHISGWDFNSSFLNCVSRPTYSQAFEWFRENHKLHHNIIYLKFKKQYLTETEGTGVYFDENKYEEAKITCLEKLIEIVEQQKTE